jgi:hypothetical protein
MAANDNYQQFIHSMTEKERAATTSLQKRTWEDLLAARSEEARLRIVEFFVEEVHGLLGKQK